MHGQITVFFEKSSSNDEHLLKRWKASHGNLLPVLWTALNINYELIIIKANLILNANLFKGKFLVQHINLFIC